MRLTTARLGLAALMVACPAAALAQTQDHAPVGLQSSARMTRDRDESWSYFRSGLDLAAYRNIIVEPTVVYEGPDAQFEDVERGDRRRYANIVTERLRRELGARLAARPGASTARLRITLLGMDRTTGGVATATRVTPMGLVSNAVRSVTGREGRLTGSMLFALELFDSRSSELLAAVVRRRAPDPLDIPATVGTTETVEAIAREMAEDIRQRLDRGVRR
jgi:hypothetical protein